MARTVVSITISNLDILPERCGACRRWCRPNERMWAPGGMADWLDGVVSHWGACWKALRTDDVTTAAALYAPPRYFSQAGFARASSISDDAVMLACLYVAPEYRGRGLGKLLLQVVEKDLLRRGVRAIETFARRGGAEEPSAPADFFLGQGFYVIRDDPESPHLRIELRSLVTWPVSIQTVLDTVRLPAHGNAPVAQSP